MGIKADDGHIPVLPSDRLSNPFGQLGVDLSDSELRAIAYELLVGACRSTGSKPLTYISQSQKAGAGLERASSLSISPSLQRSLTLTAASKVKKALGLKSSKKGHVPNLGVAGQYPAAVANSEKAKKPVTIGELIRVQMRISEQADSRIRRGHLRISAGQLGRRIDTMVLPLELLQQFKASDFPNPREYESWQRRNLRMLEAGLLLHPHLPLDKKDTNAQKLHQILRGASNRPLETGKYSETMQILRNSVMSLACRSNDGSSSEKCHWADGYPLNLRIYQTLLDCCFDLNDETSVVEEVDEVLELVKKIWVVLGMNQPLHNLIFSWVFFNRYVSTGQVENDLLIAASNLLLEVEKDSKTTNDPDYSRVLTSVSRLIFSWAEKRLVSYHDTFYSRNIDLMQIVVSLAVTSAKIMGNDSCLEAFIRSSVRSAFAQANSQAKSTKRSSANQQNLVPLLSILSQEITELVYTEKEMYCPVLKRWHPRAAGVAVATYHACYGNELKTFISNINELSPDAVQVLLAADKLERLLVRTAVEDSVDSEDGGKGLIQEMAPYEAETVIAGLVKSWIMTRVDRLKEWVDRNLQQEVWNPKANKEQIAPSAVEVLRMMDETLEAFFLLPISKHPVLLPELISGLDRCLQDYILKAKSGCGSRSTYIPTIPALTRCKMGSKFQGVFKKKEPIPRASYKRKPQVGSIGSDNSDGVQHYCVRINTLQHIRAEMEALVKRAINHLRNSGTTHIDDINKGLGKKFELSVASCTEGIHQLCETTAYKIIFDELSQFLLESLYVGEPSVSRIEPFLQVLEQYLEVVSSTVHDRARTRLITDVMKASFDGFLFVLLAGGPLRSFTRQDGDLVEEDFKFLKDLFWSNGDGLPADLIDKHSSTVKSILPLFHMDTQSLIEQFRRFTVESYGSSAKSRLPLPPTSGQWSPIDPNTLLRVLCYRNDELATKFLKKTYNMPKKL